MVLPQEPAGFFLRAVRGGIFGFKFIGNLFTVFRVHMGIEDRVVDHASTVIIPVVQLAFQGNVETKTPAASPAPVTFKHCHC
jgi:hypothetical protein